MLLTLLHLFDALSSHAPQLVAGLAICGAMLLIVSDHRLAILAFLVQRSIVIVLLWPAIGIPLAATSVIALIVIVVIYCITEWRWRGVEMSEPAHANRSRPSLTSLPFRALAASLAVLVTYGFVQTYNLNPLPPLVAFTVVWLIINSLFILFVADSALRTGLGILTFADGCRTLYALWQPNLLVWGLWGACDVLVALAASYLRSAEVIAAKSQPVGGHE